MRITVLAFTFALSLPWGALAQEKQAQDVLPSTPFKEGDTITFDQAEKLKDFLPPEFWTNREFFFYEGMQLEVGPTLRKYGTADIYAASSEKFKGKAKIGEDGALDAYTAGLPFSSDALDCKGDPNAGVKIIWNFLKAWNGDGARSTWSYTYWDRGEQLPLYYEGTGKSINLSHRIEK